MVVPGARPSKLPFLSFVVTVEQQHLAYLLSGARFAGRIRLGSYQETKAEYEEHIPYDSIYRTKLLNDTSCYLAEVISALARFHMRHDHTKHRLGRDDESAQNVVI